ncbi:hypothetical protein [Microvirga sp. CF3016]|uniref:hypothetical protein n=1 Tax=Microvirga sp. CF3016 TaxID=3110181 RepID=UPI002E799F66|nr:hypothetical protein [Microvirga sp. CF3016]MEE1611186.1 hypothetical protein [Microvirga sp. CF3016]
MTIRKIILALALAGPALHATQANALFRGSADRPPPNGLNGSSVTGRADQTLPATRDASEVGAPKAVVLPDGARVVVK